MMNKISQFVLTGMAGLAFLIPGSMMAQEETVSGDRRVVPIESALVSSYLDIQVPARVKGFIAKLNFEEGQVVEKDEVIAVLDTTSIDGEMTAAEIRLKNARLQANDNSAIDYADASLKVAESEYERELNLFQKDASTRQDLDRVRLAKRQAELQLVRSKSQKEIDGGAVSIEEQGKKAVQLMKDRHSIKAQFGGQIMSIDQKVGEFVQEGQTVVRLVDLSQVKVEGRVNSMAYNPFELKGKPVTVSLLLARDEIATFTGVVKGIGLDFSQSTGMSSTYIVEAIVKNRQINGEWIVHPGATVSMEIELEQPKP